MGKYDRLTTYLLRRPDKIWHATFEEIESVLRSRLPPSARLYKLWWWNGGQGRQSYGWRNAGWRAEGVDLKSEEVTFRKIGERVKADAPLLIEHGGPVGPAVPEAPVGQTTVAELRIEQDHEQLLALAKSLAQIAKFEIDRIGRERPNDPETIASIEKQRDLLLLFAVGFDKIAAALEALATGRPTKPMLNLATRAVKSVGEQINKWWQENGSEAVDWGARLPVFAAGVAALGWAGANMTVATTAVAAIVGGSKVVAVLKKGKRR